MVYGKRCRMPGTRAKLLEFWPIINIGSPRWCTVCTVVAVIYVCTYIVYIYAQLNGFIYGAFNLWTRNLCVTSKYHHKTNKVK